MSKLLAFIAVLFISFNIQAQPQPTEDKKKEEGSKKVETKVSESEKNPNLKLPPEKANPVNIPKISIENSITVDGNLNEEIWARAAVFKDFIQTGPGDNIAPSKPTEAYMMYDEKHLYLAFKCWDEKDKIRATVAKRDDVFGEDNVRVWLDTYNDQRRAYVLGFNPLGIQMDGIFTEGQGADFSVDIVMESKGMIHDWGWSVEVKIPFKSLRYSAGKGKLWGFNAARNIDRLNDEFDTWMPDDRNISGFLVKHGKISGLDEIKNERSLEIIPSVTLSETGSRVEDPNIPAGRFINQPIKQQYGVTLKYTITPNITLDAAINPDFAEIEADAPVVTANQRFPIFFTEKRPFFLEGSEIFQSPIQVFYSRTIEDPDVATKLTGKVGKNSFGFLVASDAAPGNFDGTGKNATFGILRLKRDFGKNNNIGFFATARSYSQRNNFLSGFDGRFKTNDSTIISFQVLGTHSRRCFFEPFYDATSDSVRTQRNEELCGSSFSNYRTGNGIGYQFQYDVTKDLWGYTFEIGGKTKDYRSDAGFARRTDQHYAFAGFRLSSKSKPKSPIIRVNWFNGASVSYDGKGRLQGWELNPNLGFNLQKNTFINLWGGVGHERIYEDEFGLARNANRLGEFFGDPLRKATQYWLGGYVYKQFNKNFLMEVNGGHTWNSYDFDFGAGPLFPRVSPSAMNGDGRLDPGTGKSFNIGIFAQYKPINPLTTSFSFNKSRLVRNDTGETAFDTNIFSSRTTYQFTRFIFTRVRWDYDTLSRNARGQMLFGWNPNPGTAFYAGYNDSFNYGGFNPFTSDHEPRFERNSRTFFIRASYLFRKSF